MAQHTALLVCDLSVMNKGSVYLSCAQLDLLFGNQGFVYLFGAGFQFDGEPSGDGTRESEDHRPHPQRPKLTRPEESHLGLPSH